MTTVFERGSNRVVVVVFLAIAFLACYWLVKPFLQPIVLAILVGMLGFPAHTRLLQLLRGRRSLAAILSCVILSLVLVIPTTMLLIAVLKQGITYSVIVRDWATLDNIRELLSQPSVVQLRIYLAEVFPENALDPNVVRGQALSAAGELGKIFAGVSTAMLGSLTHFLVNILLMLFVLFFVLRDHDGLIAFIRRALPLSRSQEDELLEEVKEVSKSALLGSLLTAATQGAVGGLGLWLAGFPGVFWGTIMAFASLIPIVGTALIWIPAALYLTFTGQYEWAVFMLAWGVVVVGAIDNFLRPMFMRGASMNTVVVFFSLIGGLQVFGLIGLIYGPLVFAIASVLFRIYEKEFSGFLENQNNS